MWVSVIRKRESVGFCHEGTRECGFLSSGDQRVWVSVIMRREGVGFCHEEDRECGFMS